MDKQLIQRLAREAGFQIDGVGKAFAARHPELQWESPVQEQLERFATLVCAECAALGDAAIADAGAVLHEKFGPAHGEKKPEPLRGMDHFYSMLPPGILRNEADVKALREERAAIRKAAAAIEIPGKFLDMAKCGDRLIILTESGVLELRPGETALRWLEPMTPADAAELDMFNQRNGHA